MSQIRKLFITVRVKEIQIIGVVAPKVSPSLDPDLKIVEWYKREGDSVALHEPLCLIETDITSFDLIADQAGHLKILYPVNSIIKGNTCVGQISPLLRCPEPERKSMHDDFELDNVTQTILISKLRNYRIRSITSIFQLLQGLHRQEKIYAVVSNVISVPTVAFYVREQYETEKRAEYYSQFKTTFSIYMLGIDDLRSLNKVIATIMRHEAT